MRVRRGAAAVLASLLAVPQVGCGPAPDPGPGPGPDTGDGDDLFADVAVEVSTRMPTVATVRWTTRDPATCRVTFGVPGEEGRLTPWEDAPSVEHAAVLVGVPQDRDVELVIEADGGATSARHGYRTGFLPAGVPAVEMTVHDATRSMDGWTLVPVDLHQEQTTWIVVLDEAAAPVWAWEGAGAPRARLAPDGSGVYTLVPYGDVQAGEGGATLVHVSWTGEVLWQVEVPSAQRDFAILGEDRLAVVVRDERVLDGYGTVVGDSVVLVDPDGQVDPLWSVFDERGPGWCPEVYEHAEDWSHVNYLGRVPEEGLLLVVSRGLDAVFALDETGALAWTLSRGCGDFENVGTPDLLSNPHSVEATGDGLLVFNQGPEPDGCSGSAEISLDRVQGGGDAEVTWSWADPACYHTYFMGNAQPLPNGNVSVTLLGQETEVTRSGEVVRMIMGALYASFNYTERLEGLYPEAAAR